MFGKKKMGGGPRVPRVPSSKVAMMGGGGGSPMAMPPAMGMSDMMGGAPGGMKKGGSVGSHKDHVKSMDKMHGGNCAHFDDDMDGMCNGGKVRR